MDFLLRHPGFTVKSPRKAWSTRKAMKAYALLNPKCEYCGCTPIHVHHIEPISEAPERAADPRNMLSLGSKRCHLVIGHAGNWRHHVKNVLQMCFAVDIDRD